MNMCMSRKETVKVEPLMGHWNLSVVQPDSRLTCECYIIGRKGRKKQENLCG